MALYKKHMLCMTAGIIVSLFGLSLFYSKCVPKIAYHIQSTVPKILSSNYISTFLAPKTYTPDSNVSSFFRDTFDPSKVPNATLGPDNITDKDKYFIYRCDESAMRVCGGWSDRIKGAMFAYMVANLTGRTFKMEMLYASCDTLRFIIPNQVNWSLPTSFHTTVTVVRPSPEMSKLDMVDRLAFIQNVDHDFLALPHMKSKYVYFKVNRGPLKYVPKYTRYGSQLAWMENLTYPEIFNIVYRRLFQPSPYLLSKVHSFLEENVPSYSKLVCIHLRMGRNPSIRDVGPNIYLKTENLTVAWEFLYNVTKRDNSRIFLMSDSQQTIDMAKHLNFSDKFFFSSGKIIHIDHAEGVSIKDKCEGYENIIFEQLVLMHCDVLVMTENSGVSRVAAFVRGTDDNLFCFFRSGQLIPCKRTDL